MKMKMFIAPTVEEAMAQVRAEFGPDAVILSERDEDGRVEIRAAVERSFNHKFAAPKFSAPAPAYDATRDHLTASLRWHGAPDGFTHMVSEAGARLGAGLEAMGTLSAGLEGVLTFAPLHPRPDRSILLVGPPGAGRSTAAAKLSRQLSERRAELIPVAADFDINGGVARLAALTLKPSVTSALTPDHLVQLVKDADARKQRLVIDAPGFNALDEGDMERLKQLIFRMNVEPVLVISAEGHPMDLEDNARAFAQAGVRRAILTKLDAVRRRGGAVAALSSARLSIAQLGLTPSVGGGLTPASAARVAQLLLVDEAAPEAELLRGAA